MTPHTRSLSRLALPVAIVCTAACAPSNEAGDDADSVGFPWPGEAPKADVFGRSLVGPPDPYIPNADVVADPAAAEARLASDMRQRRALAWETAYKILEPVPLLGLAAELEARPNCESGVADRDLANCSRHDAAACAQASSGGVTGICTWNDDLERCEPACDNLTLPDGQPIPKIPRWETWYGVEDINRIFDEAYGRLDTNGQLERRPLLDDVIGRAFDATHTEKSRSSRWPLQRYTEALLDLFTCDLTREEGESDEAFGERCAVARQSEFSGAAPAGNGIARITYSPAMVLHLMRNYGEVLDCRDDTGADGWCDGPGDCEESPDNFSTCFRAEFPADAGNPWQGLDPTLQGLPAAGGTVLVKAVWARGGFGFDLPAYDTDAAALQRRIGPGAPALWEPTGDRTYAAPDAIDSGAYPGPGDIYTIQTRSGSIYRLTGLHIMTKELRHWQWVTLWWSDKPDEDFGEDRPESFAELPGVWSNYKMCVVVDYLESDPDVVGRFDDFPSLQAALAATAPAAGAPTWCSNPYIEHEAGNARTNCIGCHQHAGTRFAEDGSPFDLTTVIRDEAATLSDTRRYPSNGRTQRRDSFAADYAWAFSRIDDLTELIRTEVESKGAGDARWQRIQRILQAEGDAAVGAELFASTTADQSCAGCHGANGEGDFGPDLHQAFELKSQWQLLHTVIHGRGNMPAWGETLSDEQLADLVAFFRATFVGE